MSPAEQLRTAAAQLRAEQWPHTGRSWIPLAGPQVRAHLADLLEAAAARNETYGGLPAAELALAALILGDPGAAGAPPQERAVEAA